MVVPYTCWGSEQSDHRFGPTTNNRTSIVNCIIRTGAGIMDWSAHVDKFQACGLCCDMPVAIRHRLQRVATMADLLECFWKLKPTEIQGYEITISGGFLAWCNLTRHVQVWAHGFQNGEWMWPTFWMAFHLELCCCSICFNNFSYGEKPACGVPIRVVPGICSECLSLSYSWCAVIQHCSSSQA